MTHPDPASPRLSVAVVTYDGERFLPQQLASILAQTPRPDEIVIGDDGSQDATLDIVRAFADRAARPEVGAPVRVRILEGGHLGLRGNMERTLAACTGDVIVLADQDDEWMPGKLDAVRRAFADPAVTLWFSDAERIDEHGDATGPGQWATVALTDDVRAAIERGDALRRLLHGQTVTGATMAFRAGVRELALPLPAELDGDDHLFLHDGWIAVLAALTGRTVADPHPYTRYRQHAAQVTAGQRARLTDAAPDAPVSTPLATEAARVRLVASRVRAATAAPDSLRARYRPGDVAMLDELDEFLRVRMLPPSGMQRRAVWGQLRRGRYAAYARGARTAARDLLGRAPR